MTYDLYVVDRAALGLKPREEMTSDDWMRLWEQAGINGFETTGEWGCRWSWVRTITGYCAPILDTAGLGNDLSKGGTLRHLSDAEFTALLRAESPHYPKIPARKFRSNDAWYFTPRECGILAYHLHNAPDPDLRRLGEFFAFARQHGGCEAS